MEQKHSRPVPGGRGFWWTETLWRESAGLPVQRDAVDQIVEMIAIAHQRSDALPAELVGSGREGPLRPWRNGSSVR